MKQQRSMKVKSFRFELFLSLSLSRSPRNYAPSFGSTFSNLFISGRKENSIARIIGLEYSIRPATLLCFPCKILPRISYPGLPPFLSLSFSPESLLTISYIRPLFKILWDRERKRYIYIPPLIFPRFFPCFRANVISPPRSTRRSHPRVTANSFYRLSFDECLQEMSR